MSLIFDIKKFAVHDGPGIRVSIFFKGCPLRCAWCHNPESRSALPQKMYSKKKCIGCLSCIEACPENALQMTPEGIVTDCLKCILCGACVKACPSKAMEMCGRPVDEEAVLKLLEGERLFFEQSGGGVTFSGGEPLSHPEALLSLLKKCGDAGFHRTVDTSLFASAEIVKSIAAETDLFLIDIKHIDSSLHKKFTGVPNELILSNIRLVAQMGVPYWIRIPLIGNANATEKNISATAQFIGTLKTAPQKIELLPYHKIGDHKIEKLGGKIAANDFYTPDEKTIENYNKILLSAQLSL